MKHFLFYTTEGRTIAPDGNEIENCQLLGDAKGNDEQDALDSLLRDNEWIQERGYDTESIVARELK